MKLRRAWRWYWLIMWTYADTFARFVFIYAWAFVLYALVCDIIGADIWFPSMVIDWLLITAYFARILVWAVQHTRQTRRMNLDRLTNIAAFRKPRQWTEDDL